MLPVYQAINQLIEKNPVCRALLLDHAKFGVLVGALLFQRGYVVFDLINVRTNIGLIFRYLVDLLLDIGEGFRGDAIVF